MTDRAATRAQSALFGSSWTFEDAAGVERIVTCETPIHSEVLATERVWKPHRDAHTAHWEWGTIMAEHGERFALRLDDGPVAAMWAADVVVAHSTYAFDFVEVAPSLRGDQVWGAVVLLFVGARAREVACERVLCNPLDGRDTWLRSQGATEHTVPEKIWHVPKGTVLRAFQQGTLEAFVEELDAHRRQ